ncbi:MAG: DUF1015 family protein [Polyangiaceae bacterium]
MAIVRAFSALRPPHEAALRVASPPYDVINTVEARALAGGDPISFLRVSRPEINLPDDTDEHDDRVYAEGRKALVDLFRHGALTQAGPSLWLYAQTMGTHRQIGVVGCASVDEYDRDVIKKHEKTRADKEDDRTRHIDEMGAHDEPVFLTYRAQASIDTLVKQATSAPAVLDFRTADGVRHEVWDLTPELSAAIEKAFSTDVDALYVADGHHRSAAASRVHAARKAKSDAGDHGVFLAVVFPHDQMQILAYNRLVRDVKGRSGDELLALLRDRFDVSESDTPAPPHPRAFGIYVNQRWYLAKAREGSFDASDPVASLDCSICQDQILAPLFGIDDPRRDKNVDFVGGIRGAAELEKRVRDEGFSLAIHLFPTQIEQLLAVSDAGSLMPPKSTWFEPKLRSGLFVHPFTAIP